MPELFGPIRTIAEGRGETVIIGTTKNFVLRGSLEGEFVPITQVGANILLYVGIFPEINDLVFVIKSGQLRTIL